MKIRYITIEREYGSGGTRIAELAAKQCGISCYGRELMEAVAKQQRVSLQELAEYEERISGKFLYSLFVMSKSKTGDPDLATPEAKLWVAETRMVQTLALNGPAIFVGHCAAHGLRDRDDVLKVFIHASQESKRERIITDYGIDPVNVDTVCRKFNKRRSDYYTFCMQQKWDDMNQYDLVLDSSRLGIAGCAAVLTALYQQGRE